MDQTQARVAFLAPLATAFAVFSAILLIGVGDELSWTRFLIGGVAFLGISVGGAWALRRRFEK